MGELGAATLKAQHGKGSDGKDYTVCRRTMCGSLTKLLRVLRDWLLAVAGRAASDFCRANVHDFQRRDLVVLEGNRPTRLRWTRPPARELCVLADGHSRGLFDMASQTFADRLAEHAVPGGDGDRLHPGISDPPMPQTSFDPATAPTAQAC